MIDYTYRAITSDGKTKNGKIQAESMRHARQLLKSQGLIVEKVEYQNKPRKSWNISFGKPISPLELNLITRQFALLISSGLSIEYALNALIDQLDVPLQKSIMLGVRNEVLAGKPLATAMRMFPKVFPNVYCSLVNAGEQSGNLAQVMLKLADYSDRTRALTSKIMMAMLYPIIISIVAIAMISGLLVYVVPKIVGVFISSHQALPLLTAILINVSDFLRSYGIYLLISIALIVFIFWRLLQNKQFKIKFHRNLLKLPVAGRLLINVDVARFTSTLSMLLSSGVSMIVALQAGRDTIGNYMIKAGIDNAITQVQSGVSLATALKKEKIFPAIVIHLIASGEKSGNLSNLLEQASSHQELELSHRSQLLTGILEPVMILVMGGIVLLIVIAIMLPIVDLNNLVN